MNKDIFFNTGLWIYKYRWLTLCCWIALIVCSFPFTLNMPKAFKSIGYFDPNSESTRAANVLNDQLNYSINRFIIIYKSNQLKATYPSKFLQEVDQSLDSLKNFPVPHTIIRPTNHPEQISANKHTAYAIVLFKSNIEVDPAVLEKFKTTIKKPPSLDMHLGGEAIFLDDAKKQSQTDLLKAEFVATPVAILAMLFVFGSVVAASIPIVMGVVCVEIIFFTLYMLGKMTTLSVFTLNIAILLGLCLSLDYALLIVSRFRDELAQKHSVMDALAITLMTAGKSVFFSGLAVFVSLSALLLFPIKILTSVGLSGLITVFVTVFIALTLLPAVLAILNYRIDYLSINFLKRKTLSTNYFGTWLTTKIIRNPGIFFVFTLVLLILFGYPFLHVKFDISDYKILPNTVSSHQAFNIFNQEFGDNKLSPILVVVKTPQKNISSPDNIYYLYDFAHEIARDPRVDHVDSIVTNEPRLNKIQYQFIYNHPLEAMDASLAQFYKLSTHGQITILSVFSKYSLNSPQTLALIHKLRHSNPGNGMTLEVTGATANLVDVLSGISITFPVALFFIVFFTYIILLLLFRSIFLPIKAIIMNILSLTACFGILVLIFQDGYLSSLLNFEPQHFLDISMLIVIFCGVFGVSMDYEVFMLTRIKEFYEKTYDINDSVLKGTVLSSKIINNAALIVILISLSFVYSADIVLVKAFGLGIAVAVFVDAFLIRTIMVPATMCLLKDWNWYLPPWLDEILPNIKFDADDQLPPKA